MPDESAVRVGVNLLKQLSTTFYSNSRMVFDELITNARDSMATNVDIHIYDNSVIIEDDGEGMNPEELRNFFYISFTDKNGNPMKERDGVKRRVIGKFGLGKTSMYTLCKSFKITTWKEGKESVASFDFGEVEKKKFLDEIQLVVKSSDTGVTRTGTRIVMNDLRKKIRPNMLIYGLSRSMPLSPDFVIRVNGNVVEPEMRVGSEHEIDDEIDGLGRVTGRVIYTEKNLSHGEAGLYVRVFGRVVNENPRIIDFSSLVHAHIYSRRVWGDINADFLNDAIQSNRNGFITDHPSYTLFTQWLRKKLNSLNEKEYRSHVKRRTEMEADILPVIVAERIDGEHKKAGSKQITAEHAAQKRYVMIGGRKFEVKVQPMGSERPECEINENDGTLVINSSHPMYLEARKRGCLIFHAIKAAIIYIALSISSDLGSFKKEYDRLVRGGVVDFEE